MQAAGTGRDGGFYGVHLVKLSRLVEISVLTRVTASQPLSNSSSGTLWNFVFRLDLAEGCVLLDLRGVSVQRVVGPCTAFEALAGFSARAALNREEPCSQDGHCLPPRSLAVACCSSGQLDHPGGEV